MVTRPLLHRYCHLTSVEHETKTKPNTNPNTNPNTLISHDIHIDAFSE